MNYLLKRQPSPSVVVECLFSNSKQNKLSCTCSCANSLHFHPVFRNAVPKINSSTYVSALKMKVVRNRISRKTKNINNSKKIAEALKVLPLDKCKEKRNKNQSEVDEIEKLIWRSRYSDCTKSYDPNLFNCNLAVENFYKEYMKKKNLKGCFNSKSLKNLETLEVPIRYLPKDVPNKNSQVEETASNTVRKRVFQIQRNEKIAPIEKNEVLDKSIFYKKFQENISAQSKTMEDQKTFRDFCVNISENFSVIELIHSSIDICICNGKVLEAYNLFQSFRRRPIWKTLIKSYSKKIREVYNCLLFALSSKGYWHLFTKVTSWMEADNIKLNSRSFAAHLLCLANVKETTKEDSVHKNVLNVLNMVFQNNISLNDIVCKTNITKEASEKILGIIRRFVPPFEIEPIIMELSSNCPLLKNLHLGAKAGLSNLQAQLDGFGVEAAKRLIDEQSMLEKNFRLAVKAVSSGLPHQVPEKRKKRIEVLKNSWRKSLTAAILRYQKTEESKFFKAPTEFNIQPYLNCLPVEKFVDILIDVILSLVGYSGCYSPSADQLRRTIGRKVFQCYQLQKIESSGYAQKVEKLTKEYVSWYLNPSGPAMNSRQKWQMLLQDFERNNNFGPEVVSWPNEVNIKVGKFLLEIILKNVKFTLNSSETVRTVPVFYNIMRYRESACREELKCHPSVTEMFESVGFDVLYFPSEEVPMVCPPKPWRSTGDGGYIFLHTDFIRIPGGISGRKILFNDVPQKQMFAVLDSLNALQAVPWMVNEGVLDVALEVFKNGGSDKLCVPLYPVKPSPPVKRKECETYGEFRDLFLKRRRIVKKLANNYSLWCEALYRLSLANHFRKKVFWLPQNLDFRGRVYPVPPLMNHLGSDLFRSLFIFAKGKPLGPKGLDWLKIHLINLTGTHKRKSMQERLEYANEILPDILDSAEKPLTGDKWWMESEEPWQTLATCMELKKAISLSDPAKYICRIPIHQDGSCNGLQHYAALGKDLIGAKSVNLVPSFIPQDVYTVVADMVEKERQKDAARGVEIAQVLEGFIERKVVKQTVMTTVYGVTAYGAKLQIIKRLEEFPNFPENRVIQASSYLTDKTFFSLKQMFTSAKEIQDWFINCAHEICKRNDYVQWVSPLGLPVLQPYAKHKLNSATRNKETVPDSMKQKNAFPPNFIHSLDSTHMMLTALYSEQAGITFAAIHDCFWTHPCDVDIMSRICREQFIALHKQSILEELSGFFKKTYTNNNSKDEANKVFEAVPEKGSFDVDEVMNSVYFFS